MTTTHTRRVALGTAILAACAAGGALAEDPNGLTQCSSISNTAERLACYDRLAGRGASASNAPPSSPATAAPAAAPVNAPPAATTPAAAAPAAATPVPAGASTASDFGLSKVQKERADGAASSSPAEIKSITARVAGFRRGPSGLPRVLLLDNGQTWEYEDDGDYLLAVGDSVTIRRASLGSFLLITPSKLIHRVRRIR
jgi:hypothetical protein